MKKMKTLFEREFTKDGIIIHNKVTQGCEWVYTDNDIRATAKFDGTCCMVKDGELFRRFDYKQGRKLPEGAIPCQEIPDLCTGHFPHWVPCSVDSPEDKHHIRAFDKMIFKDNGTYELCGPQFNRNKHNLKQNVFIKHGTAEIELEDKSFEGIKEYLQNTSDVEGIVFYHPDGRMCKIKKTDFGIKW